jgi:hypothetical protein
MVTVRADRRGLQLPQSGSVYMDLENFVGYAVEFRWTPKPAGRSQNLYTNDSKQRGLCQDRSGEGNCRGRDEHPSARPKKRE